MNLNAIENSKQEDYASNGRRGFMKMVGAVLGAGIAVAAPAQAIAAMDTSVFVTPAPFDDAKMRGEYDQQMLVRLCQSVGLLHVWYHANKDRIHFDGGGQGLDLEDLMFEASESARAVAKSAGAAANWDYVAKRGMSPRQRKLLLHFDAMTESAQQFVVDLAEQNARVFPRQRPKLSLVAGGAA